MTTQTQSFLQGEVVDGKFHLRQYLGGTDRGAVFLTEYGSMRPQNAAIKLVPVRPGNAELQLSRWRLAANLSHHNLVRIFDMGRCEVDNSAMLYVVMELAEENLAQIIPERPLTPEEARDMLAPVLDALAYMHSRGFVHGHIKPSNIMAIGDELKLSSDGICHLAESVESVGLASPYEPPEGTRNGASPAGDIWSLGMTLVEVLTQQMPSWDGERRKELIVSDSLPEAFVDIVRRCLRREPKSRWTAPDIIAHLPRTPLAAPARPAPIDAPPPEPAPEQSEWVPDIPVESPSTEDEKPATRRYVIGATAVAAVLLAIFGGAKLFSGRSAARESAPTAAKQPKPLPTPPAAERPKAVAAKQAEAPKQTAPPNQVVSSPVKEATRAEMKPSNATPASAPVAVPAPTEATARTTDSESVRGGVLHQVLPDVPRKASGTIWGTVRVNVKVRVDPSGNVTAADLDAAGPSRYFAKLSLDAARDWKFAPPKVNGAAVASAWILHFGYTNAGANVTPSQTSP